jgi:mxaJ protein
MSSPFPDRDGRRARRCGRVVLLRACLVGAVGVPWAPAFAQGNRAAPAQAARELRVCADPNNLPFSNARGEGIENRLADVVARELGARVTYTWWAQRRGFVRETLQAGRCDVMLGVPTSFERVLATRPYYRSTYVFVSRRDRRLDVTSFDDPRLRRLRIGVQLVGDDGANTPPVHALGARGIVRNVRGYSLYGDYAQENPPARIIDAVVAGDVDLAVVWGPLAGYFAKRSRVPLVITPVSPQIELPFLPQVFDISMGVRRGDTALRARLDSVIERRREVIDRVLAEFGVPRLDHPSVRGGTRGGAR